MYIPPIIATVVLVKDWGWACCVGRNPPPPTPLNNRELTVRRVAGEVGLLVLERTSKSIAPSW